MTQSLHNQSELVHYSWLDSLITPAAGKMKIEEFEQILTEAKNKGILVRPVFDINQTLGVFTASHGEFFPEVLSEFVKLLSKVPVTCITGDQKNVVKDQFLPVIRAYVEGQNFSKDEKAKIYNNLVIYAQTGVHKLTLNKKGNEKVVTQSFMQLTTSELEIIRNKIIPTIIQEFSSDPIYQELIEAGYKPPCTSSYEPEENQDSPLFTQFTKEGKSGSIELSIFGIYTDPIVKKTIKKTILAKPEAQVLIENMLTRSNELLDRYINYAYSKKMLPVRAQKGGTSTVDFRKGSKDIAMFVEIGNDIHWIKPTLVVGIADSFGKNGNDASLENVSAITFDVSQNNQNAENIVGVLKGLNKIL